jgi:two-component system sensor histidine kinase QseC
MHGRASLKQRLLALALTMVVAVWIGAATFTYFDARAEFNEVLDAHLAQDAALLAVQSTHELDELDTEHTPQLHKYSRRIAFQIWENGQLLRLHSVNAPQQRLSNVERGFSDRIIDGLGWRVFSTWNDSGEYLIQVAERTDVRNELARGIATNLLRPLLLSLPLLALLLWAAVTRGLRPLDKLAHEVEQRDPEALTPLETEAAPREVVPLIEKLNRLFARIDDAIQKERRFTADAAHELRTPVAAIKAQAQVARAASAEAERIHALDNAILGCDRATHLIEQLLALARVDTLDNAVAEPCRIRDIAAVEIAEIAPAALAKGVRIELQENNQTDDAAPVGNVPEVRGNSQLLRLLLRNLIDNAVRHTPPGTTVRVNIINEPGKVSLSVSDDGPGLAEQELSRVSERFYRPHGTLGEGSGLGLSIVKRIAEVHNAALQFTAADNGLGLRVTVVFRQ